MQHTKNKTVKAIDQLTIRNQEQQHTDNEESKTQGTRSLDFQTPTAAGHLKRRGCLPSQNAWGFLGEGLVSENGVCWFLVCWVVFAGVVKMIIFVLQASFILKFKEYLV